jgi:uroporphyrinogen-III synthase
MNDRPLAGVGVLVTRPEHQSGELVHAIEAAGGKAFLFPVIDVVPRTAAAIDADLCRLQTPDIVIFVSANAVQHGLRSIGDSSARIAAVGPATAKALQDAGVSADILPERRFDSEGLLATEALTTVAGRVVTIVRGESGREVLADTLRVRGATVQYLSVYRLETHRFSSDELDALEALCRAARIDAIVVMSVASLDSLLAVLPACCRERLAQTRLVAPSARVIQTALERLPGLRCALSPGPQAADVTAALIASLETDPDTNNE